MEEEFKIEDCIAIFEAIGNLIDKVLSAKAIEPHCKRKPEDIDLALDISINLLKICKSEKCLLLKYKEPTNAKDND